MTDKLVIHKDSEPSDIQKYFEYVVEIQSTGEKYPIDLNDVWRLVYTRKDDAVHALKLDFLEEIDYQSFRRFPERGAASPTDYVLTSSCFEYFIARKVRSVFEVYRKVFHKAVHLELPQSFAEALRLAADLSERSLALQQENLLLNKQSKKQIQTIEAQRPAVIFAESVTASKSSILIGELAKILSQNGVEMGQNRLFEWMRQHKYLVSGNRSDYNMPTQHAVQLGLFEIKETAITHSDGQIHISKTVKVTGKGQIYITNQFLAKPLLVEKSVVSVPQLA
jgi:anti-repressor protein